MNKQSDAACRQAKINARVERRLLKFWAEHPFPAFVPDSELKARREKGQAPRIERNTRGKP